MQLFFDVPKKNIKYIVYTCILLFSKKICKLSEAPFYPAMEPNRCLWQGMVYESTTVYDSE